MPEEKAKITVIKDGPYLVEGNIPLSKQVIRADKDGVSVSWEKTHEYPQQSSYRLCRCGKSKNKPFCDGSHATEKFDGTETASHEPYLDQAERFEGVNLILTDAYDLCASARFCDRAGSVWNLIRQSDAKSRQTAIEECADCPSGRLVIHDQATGQAIEPEFEQEISVTEDPAAGISGPIWVKGGIPIESADGEVYEIRNRVTLCRCGKSKNKPFCDSGHVQSHFNDGDSSLSS